jgi:hypothetical protein
MLTTKTRLAPHHSLEALRIQLGKRMSPQFMRLLPGRSL